MNEKNGGDCMEEGFHLAGVKLGRAGDGAVKV